MKSLTFSFLIIFCLSYSIRAQMSPQWDLGMSGQYGFSIAVDSSHNSYVANIHGYIAKLDPQGDSLFAITPFPNVANLDPRILLDHDGNLIVASAADVSPDRILLVEKWSPSGNLIWTLPINTPMGNDERVHALTIDSQNNIYVTGKDQTTGLLSVQYTAKVTTSGSFVWGKSIGAAALGNEGNSIAVFDSNAVYSVGTGESNTGAPFTRIIKYDANGDTLWVREFKYSTWAGTFPYSQDYGIKVQLDESGNVYVLSRTLYPDPGVILKYDPSGTLLWVTEIDTFYRPVMVDMIVSDSSIYVGGTYTNTVSVKWLYGSRYDLDGNLIYANWSNASPAFAFCMAVNHGGLIVSGKTDNGGSADYVTVRFGRTGAVEWSDVHLTGVFEDDVPWAMALDNDGGVYITGKGYGVQYGQWQTFKYQDCYGLNDTIINTGYSLQAPLIPGALYEWKTCANAAVSQGIDMNEFFPSVSGSYKVTVSIGSCSATTTCYNFTCQPRFFNITDIVCNSFTSPSGNFTWTTSGTYQDTIYSGGGCDSIFTFNLTILPNAPLQITGDTLICSGTSTVFSTSNPFSSYLWSTGATTQSITVSTAGTYSLTATAANGCHDYGSVSLNLIVPSIQITAQGPVSFCVGGSVMLSATPGLASYQWLRNSLPISGATTSNYTVTVRGKYSCSIQDNNQCTAVSNQIQVWTPCIIIGPSHNRTVDSNEATHLRIYPNPGNGLYTLESPGGELRIYSLHGTLVFSEKINDPVVELDISTQGAGVYFLELRTDSEVMRERLVVE